MSDAVELMGATTKCETPPVKPLDEAVWQAWYAKGRAEEKRSRETRIKTLTWASIVALLAAAGLGLPLTHFEIVIRALLTAAAAGMMFVAFNRRQYWLGVAFAGLALLYNPVVPVFSFSGAWQRALVAASAIPFVISLFWRGQKAAHSD